MADITATKDTERQEGQILHYLVEEATTIEEGAAVSVNAAGYAVNASDAANDIFVGVAHKKVDNSAGADGAEYVEVWTNGVHSFVSRFSAAQANIGDKVYAFDNQTVDLAANLTNDVLVGKIVEVVSTAKVRVALTPWE